MTVTICAVVLKSATFLKKNREQKLYAFATEE